MGVWCFRPVIRVRYSGTAISSKPSSISIMVTFCSVVCHKEGLQKPFNIVLQLELARTFGYLLANGWKPRRTIVLASWDAEEYGLVGSTEWVEDNREWLEKECVAYINGTVLRCHF